MASGAEVIGAAIYHALGPEDLDRIISARDSTALENFDKSSAPVKRPQGKRAETTKSIPGVRRYISTDGYEILGSLVSGLAGALVLRGSLDAPLLDHRHARRGLLVLVAVVTWVGNGFHALDYVDLFVLMPFWDIEATVKEIERRLLAIIAREGMIEPENRLASQWAFCNLR